MKRTKMDLVLLFFSWFSWFASLIQGQSSNLDALICPLPALADSDTADNCALYSACEWTGSTCRMKSDTEIGYTVVSAPQDTGRGFMVQLKLITKDLTLYDHDIGNLTFEVINHEDYHVEIKITDSDESRYEVPVPLNLPSSAGSAPMYTVSVSDVGNPFSFTVSRNSNGNSLFQTVGPLTYEDQFIQFSSSLLTSYVYGFGESTHTTFRRQFDPRSTYAIFARDRPISTTPQNEYGHHPYYMVMEDDQGTSHSCLIFNSNAMEYSTFLLDDGTPALTLRTIGGILDMHFFLGPNPEDLNNQYINMIGLPVFPSYYSLGFQISRWGYTSTDEIRTVRQRTKDNGIPQDIQVVDIDYMDSYRDFTLDSVNWGDFNSLIQELHDDNVKVMIIIDPGVVVDWSNYPPGQRGLDADAFVKWSQQEFVPSDQPEGCGSYVVGYCWPNNKTVYPDFFKPEAQDWWINEIQTYHNTIDFDLLWIDMNEPANYGTDTARPWNYPTELPDWSLKCPYNTLDSPPYTTATVLNGESFRVSDHTICMSSNHTDGTNVYSHYDVHSLYGWSQAEPTQRAMDTIFPGERNVVLSRSTFVGSGQYVVHWLGDDSADWSQMPLTIIGIMEFSMFGIPHVGADICGFFGDTTEELCARWMELGAFYPFSRNHNADGYVDQDPGMWPSTVAVYSRDALLLRYQYLPYLYYLFYNAHVFGGSVIRPLLNVYPDDLTARDIDDQFLWGDAIMITPILEQGLTQRDVYFPTGSWYDLRTGQQAAAGPVTNSVSVPIDYIPVYIRGGTIVPFQEPAVTTTESRLNPFGLTIAIDSGSASGNIFWDDGITADDIANSYTASVTYSQGELQLTVTNPSTYVSSLNIEILQFYGYSSQPNSVAVNGAGLDSSSWTYSSSSQVLNVTLSVPLSDDLDVVIA